MPGLVQKSLVRAKLWNRKYAISSRSIRSIQFICGWWAFLCSPNLHQIIFIARRSTERWITVFFFLSFVAFLGVRKFYCSLVRYTTNASAPAVRTRFHTNNESSMTISCYSFRLRSLLFSVFCLSAQANSLFFLCILFLILFFLPLRCWIHFISYMNVYYCILFL